ncbi:precorrin-8X methylmutase [Vulcanisaeta sp. JCM 16159]|uniref:precorrin-8X methylmutase n=1 Tax=Vulcanisaeta sp. JCM 16159 TaxID=1295371 RepID=UPI0006CFB36D|nr:precorrin-8X methylmutase [Vulcanisaeta sp. JCM 16159]
MIALAFLGPGNHVIRDIMGSLGVQEFNRWVRASWSDYEFEVYVTRPLIDSALVKEALLMRIVNALNTSVNVGRYIMDPEEIERNSLDKVVELVRRELGTNNESIIRLVAKAVFATGNPALIKYMHVDPEVFNVFSELINGNATVIADVKMVAVGVRWGNTVTLIDDADATKLAMELGITRAAASMRMGLSRFKPAIPIIGNSPTALIEVIKMIREGLEIPMVIATPPGFTNAVDAKEELIRMGIPSVVVRGTYGGSNVAVAVFNELLNIVREGHGR